jgi:hypothetical protein
MSSMRLHPGEQPTWVSHQPRQDRPRAQPPPTYPTADETLLNLSTLLSPEDPFLASLRNQQPSTLSNSLDEENTSPSPNLNPNCSIKCSATRFIDPRLRQNYELASSPAALASLQQPIHAPPLLNSARFIQRDLDRVKQEAFDAGSAKRCVPSLVQRVRKQVAAQAGSIPFFELINFKFLCFLIVQHVVACYRC